MDFSLTSEQEAIVETATRFADERLRPGCKAREAAGLIERDLFKEMGALGLLGTELPERFGGLGTGTVITGLITEAMSLADVCYGYVTVNTSLCGQIIANFAEDEVKQEFLPPMLAGESIAALALTEPRGGSDAASLVLKARRDGNDYVLDGEKTSISFATQSQLAVLFARTGDVDERARGVSAFVVPYGIKGLSTSAFDDLGGRAVGRGSLFFDGVRIPARYRLGEEGQGFVQVMGGFDFSRALIGLQCLGAAKQSLKETWDYIRERKAFGKVLSNYQGVTFPLSESETFLEAARLICLRTLWLKDAGLPHTAEAAMCKWWAPKVAAEIIQTCLLSHGHSGYSSDLPFEKRLRDVLGLQIGDGTAQIMKLIIARQKAGRAMVP